MRYAIFSDIHSNLEAYEAVLKAIEGEKVGKYCCVGDIVGYGADPSACIDKTRQLNPCIVAGNHDWGAVGSTDITYFTQNAKEAVIWTGGVLTQTDKEYLKNLEVLYKKDFIMVHGSLNKPERFEYMLGLSEAYVTFSLMDKEDMCFVGHSHVAGIFVRDAKGDISYNSWPQVKVEKGNKYIVNVGSVGQPRDCDPRAAYCVYDTENGMIEIKRLQYDIKRAQEKIIKANLPRILAERLSIGR